jgi:pyruvate dehydrogenase E1 component beta subunit
VKLPAYTIAIRETIRELADSRPETVLLAAGDDPGIGLPTHRAAGASGVLGVAVGLALSGRSCAVSLSPTAAALAALERWFHATPATFGSDPAPILSPLLLHVPLDPTGPPLGRLASLPGLRIVAPSTVTAAVRALREAFATPGATLFLEDRRLASCRDDDAASAAMSRSATTLTIVAGATMARAALRAALVLAERGIDVEVIEPRALAPIEVAEITGSIWRTHRALVVEEGATPWGASMAAAITEAAFDELDAPVEVVRVPPGAPTLPEALSLGAAAITQRASWLLGLPADAPVVEA